MVKNIVELSNSTWLEYPPTAKALLGVDALDFPLASARGRLTVVVDV